jgi:hypothetical protein
MRAIQGIAAIGVTAPSCGRLRTRRTKAIALSQTVFEVRIDFVIFCLDYLEVPCIHTNRVAVSQGHKMFTYYHHFSLRSSLQTVKLLDELFGETPFLGDCMYTPTKYRRLLNAGLVGIQGTPTYNNNTLCHLNSYLLLQGYPQLDNLLK